MNRLKSGFWVAAHLRRCAIEGIEAVLRRRGAEDAGAIFVALDRLDGTADLYGPAPQSIVPEDELGRLFTPILSGVPPAEIEVRMGREIRFDPDLWWIAIDDRAGRSRLEIVTERPEGDR